MLRLFAVLVGCWLLIPCSATAGERPNVIWIIADDLGPELGCYGYPGVATPNLDRLASSGARYTHAFSTSPVCSASRTAFQTGQYQTTVGGHHHNTRDKPCLARLDSDGDRSDAKGRVLCQQRSRQPDG